MKTLDKIERKRKGLETYKETLENNKIMVIKKYWIQVIKYIKSNKEKNKTNKNNWRK